MQFLVALAGIMTGSLLAIYATQLIPLPITNTPRGSTTARLSGVIAATGADTLTLLTSKGTVVRLAYSPETSWQSVDYKTVGSTTVRAIMNSAEATAFIQGSKIRAYVYNRNGNLTLGRAVKIVNE